MNGEKLVITNIRLSGLNSESYVFHQLVIAVHVVEQSKAITIFYARSIDKSRCANSMHIV